MIEVNLDLINSLICTIATLNISDEEVAELSEIDPNNEQQVRAVFRQYLTPRFSDFGPRSKVRLKESLKYLLNCKDGKLLDYVSGEEPPFYLPDPPIKYFIWLWEELFDKENYLVTDLSQYKANNKFGEGTRT